MVGGESCIWDCGGEGVFAGGIVSVDPMASKNFLRLLNLSSLVAAAGPLEIAMRAAVDILSFCVWAVDMIVEVVGEKLWGSERYSEGLRGLTG